MRILSGKTIVFGFLTALGALGVPSCGDVVGEGGTDSNTHWLDRCSGDADCGSLRCLCGICTVGCDAAAPCEGLGQGATCAAYVGCSASEETVCVASCDSPSDCPSGLTCSQGQCIPVPSPDAGEPSRECSKTSDCVVVDQSCCGTCGMPSIDDVLAMRADSVQAWRASTCEPSPPCVACVTGVNPALLAVCLEGECTVIDAQEQMGCAVDADCAVRTKDCCECGGDVSEGGLTAISDPAGYLSKVCQAGDACDACFPLYPDTVSAACDQGQDVCVLVPRQVPVGDAGTVDPEVCSLAPDSGPCDGASTRWAYDPKTASCQPFTYGLCGGNANNFPTQEACDLACAARADHCAVPGPELPTNCESCPTTRFSENGGRCEVKDLTCTFLPSCGAVQCTCHDDGTGNLVWECLGNLC